MTAAEQPAPRRRVLAEIALQDTAPLPSRIEFRKDGHLWLQFDTLAEAFPWARLLGAEVEPYDNPDGNTYLRGAPASWLGWTVTLWACEPTVPADALDDETRGALGKITAAAE